MLPKILQLGWGQVRSLGILAAQGRAHMVQEDIEVVI